MQYASVRTGEALNWHIPLEASLAVVGVVLAYLTFRRWLPRKPDLDFEPELSITRKNGWAFLDLVLINRTKHRIWAEEGVFAMADLDADFQAGPASDQQTLRIREYVRAGEALRISLVETVYKCAGRPQGEYSFLISGTTYRLIAPTEQIGRLRRRILSGS